MGAAIKKLLRYFFKLCLLLYCSFAYAERQVEVFLPHMAIHEVRGCPFNSSCTAELGQQMQRWLDLIEKHKHRPKAQSSAELEKFRKAHGIPIATWIRPDHPRREQYIMWDSPCQQHHEKEQAFFMKSLSMARDFRSFQTSHKTPHGPFLTHAWLFLGKEVISFPTPRGEYPLMTQGKNLIFNLQEEDFYYSLRVSPDGQVQIVDVPNPQEFPRGKTCSPQAEGFFQKLDLLPRLHQVSFCQEIWDAQSKTMHEILLLKSCL